jgi:hypothetical protein
VAECKHGLDIDFCHACKHDRTVYLTGGGSAYHSRIDCEHLDEGQELVRHRGGVPAAKQTSSESQAITLGRRPCRHCC